MRSRIGGTVYFGRQHQLDLLYLVVVSCRFNAKTEQCPITLQNMPRKD